jgi:hypothetical protein
MAVAGLARARRGAALLIAMAAAALAGAGPAQARVVIGDGGTVAPAAAAGSASAAAGSAPAAAGCGRAAGPFRVSGTRVLDGSGAPFVSYGTTVAGLQGSNWASQVASDLAEITAAALHWCANTVRIQADQDYLLGPGGTGVNPAYLAALKAEVSLAESFRLVVVLNDETNFSPPSIQQSERGPTPGTEVFWKIMTNLYGSDPQVIFDLFNEPRTYQAGMSAAQEWALWRNGGTFRGVSYPFGMAALASYVRDTLGAQNLFWIEGPNFSASFAGMTGQGALLHTSGIVYAVHHPGGQASPASWNADFGYLVTGGIAPVVDGEWTNYEPAPTASPTPPRTSCWPDAPARVPEFLGYLAAHGIGLNVYALQPGVMIKSFSDMSAPTTIDPATWTCQSDAEVRSGQGAGAEVLAWFEQRNRRPGLADLDWLTRPG